MDSFFKIRLNSLHASDPMPFDLYILINGRHVHYLRSGDNLAHEKITNLEKKSPDVFFIKSEDRQLYKDYVSGYLNSERLSVKEKALILRESTFTLVEELFESPDIAQALTESKEVINQFVNLMEEAPEGMADLIGLSSHDFYTYNHSLDVAIYSLGLGSLVGYKGQELHTLGQGALFHDIGKRNVPIEIITKAGPLDDEEWAMMKKHPEFGLRILNEHTVADEVKACCFEHHESMQGNGYPQALSAEQIHDMAKVVALSDTYDALTTKRSYSQPMTPNDALDLMKNKLASRFDPALLNAMISILFK